MRCLGLLLTVASRSRRSSRRLIPGLGDKTELARCSPSTRLKARAADADAARGTRQGVPVGDPGNPHPMVVDDRAPSCHVIGLLGAGLGGHGIAVEAWSPASGG